MKPLKLAEGKGKNDIVVLCKGSDVRITGDEYLFLVTKQEAGKQCRLIARLNIDHLTVSSYTYCDPLRHGDNDRIKHVFVKRKPISTIFDTKLDTVS